MRKLKKYIAMILICTIVTPILITANAQEENMRKTIINNALTVGSAKVGNAEAAKHIEAAGNVEASERKEVAEKAEASEGKEVAGNAETEENKAVVRNTEDVGDNKQIPEMTGEIENAEVSESTLITEGTEGANSVETTESTERQQIPQEKEDFQISDDIKTSVMNCIIEEETVEKNNETFIARFTGFDMYGQDPLQEIEISDRRSLTLPDKITIINSNNKESEIEAAWTSKEDILNTEITEYKYILTLPEGYALTNELQAKLKTGYIQMPFMIVKCNDKIASIREEVGNTTKKISNNNTVDTELYVDGYLNGYRNVCKPSGEKPKITFYSSSGSKISGKAVNGITYLPENCKVKITWESGCTTVWACKNLSVWQYAKDGFSDVYHYNFGQGSSSNMFDLRGKSSGQVGKKFMKKSKTWSQSFSIEELKKIKFICASLEYNDNYAGYVEEYYYVGDLFKVQKDNTPPNLNYKVEGELKDSGWYKGKAKLKLTAIDTGSGVKSITVNNKVTESDNKSIDVEEGSNDYSFYATDNIGNTSTQRKITVKVDDSKPVNVSIALNSTAWTNDKSQLILKGQDKVSGLSTMIVQYSPNSTGSWTDYATVTFKGKLLGTKELQTDKTIYANKNGYYKVTVKDRVGYYTESAILNVTNLDQTSPTLEHTIEGDLKSSGWYKGDAQLKLTASDKGGSGIKSITVNEDEREGNKREIDVTQEGSNEYICYATDHAGGVTFPNLKEIIKVDKTAPINLSMTLNTTEWTKNPIKITVKAEDTQSGIDAIVLQYTKDKKDDLSWTDYRTEAFDGEKLVSREIPVTDNGHYRLVVIDKVGFEKISDDILEVNHYDDVNPDGNTIGVERDTIQWVNESTGVNVTSYGSDNESGLSEVAVQEYNNITKQYQDIKIKEYNGETTVENATYNTQINEMYRSRIADRAGNYLTMPEKDALQVDNIDSEAPTLAIETISNPEQYISSSNGFIIQAIIEDSQSGFSEAALQKLTKNENGDYLWEDTQTKYKIIQSNITEKLEVNKKLIETESEGIEAALGSSSKVADKAVEHSNETEEEKTEEESTKEIRKQGKNKVIIEYIVRENGVYRLKGVDLVNNAAYTNKIIEINRIDGSMPDIKVKGNPTKWQNTDATITVIATDPDSKIAEMTLNGEAKDIKVKETGEFYFTFDATKNQEFEVSAQDEAGNTTIQIINVTKIDKELPTLSVVKDSVWNSEGYRNMSLIGADLLSGIDTITLKISDAQMVLGKYEYEKAQKLFEKNYRVAQNGDYILTIKDHAGNITTLTITEVEAKILKAIEIVTPPKKNIYYIKENFCKKGMIVDAIYNNNSRTKDIKDYVILNGKRLPLEKTKIGFSYTEGEVTVYADTPIKVKEKLVPEPIEPNPDEPIQPEPPVTPTIEPAIEDAPQTEIKELLKEPITKVEEKKTECVLKDVKERKKFPFLEMFTTLGFIIIIVFLILSNVKVYSEELDGSWKYLGKTRTVKVKEFYVVKLTKVLRIRAESDSYRLVFSKSFKKLHEECEVVIKIDQKNYKRYLPQNSDTVYVEHRF